MSAAYHTTLNYKRGNKSYYTSITKPSSNNSNTITKNKQSSSNNSNNAATPNRYRFQGFSERISNISIDSLFRSIQHVDNDQTIAAADDTNRIQTQSHFLAQFYKSRELDCSAQFNAFGKRIQPLIQ